ncbi:hypothetical protein H1R20_g8792, partial [Candolleomyces eurysporus]
MASNNLARLTRAHSAVAAKRHAKRRQLAEVVFDDEARREFLTGFHKRKKAKTEAARKKAKERERQDRLQDRRERRQALREQAQENAHKVEQAYAAAILGDAVDDDAGDDDEWHGVTPSSATEKDAQYQGEEVVATVTVVEDFDPSTLTTAGPVPAQGTSEEFTEPNSTSKPPSSHEKPPSKLAKRKVKEKKIYYETKQARKHQREKQRGRKLEKAERAGGKASRQKRAKR